jgi:Restriction endonuclease
LGGRDIKMTDADTTSFPAETDVAGRLMLSGADALGPNPWITPRPEPEAHGLSAADLDAKAAAASLRKTEVEMRQISARVISSFLIPLSAFAAAYYILVRDVTTLPAFEWTVYLGASLVLAALTAYLQTRHHAEAKEAHEHLSGLDDRRLAFRAKEGEWLDAQRKRTTTKFWTEDIAKIAAEKGVPPGDVFAQEIGKLFVAWGWLVKLNQRAHDYGVDIFTNGKEGSAVVQCKHADSGPSSHDIRDLAGSRHAFGSDFGLLVSVHPPTATRQNEFYSEKGQLEFWHLGHILEQCLVLYRQRTGEYPPDDESRLQFLNADGTPLTIADTEGETIAAAAAE